MAKNITPKGDKSTFSTAPIDAATGALQKYQKKLNVTLSSAQTEQLEKCEAIIKRGWSTFLEVGRALATIRDEGLFNGKYNTFEDYWRIELGYSRSYAYNLI